MKRRATTNDCENCTEKNICEVQNMMNNYGLQCKMFSPYRPYTNADRLRAMSDEELAEYLCKSIRGSVMMLFPGAHYSDADVEELNREWLDWLRQEAQDV